MLRLPLKGALKKKNYELYNLSTPILIRFNNGYTMNSRLSHKVALSVSKKYIFKKNNTYISVDFGAIITKCQKYISLRLLFA